MKDERKTRILTRGQKVSQGNSVQMFTDYYHNLAVHMVLVECECLCVCVGVGGVVYCGHVCACMFLIHYLLAG